MKSQTNLLVPVRFIFQLCRFTATALSSLLLAVSVLGFPPSCYAQSSARDADIDLKMNATALTGMAPPTGAQSASAVLIASSGAPKFDPYALAAIQSGQVTPSQKDGKARVYEVRGNALLIKKGSPDETKLKKGTLLEIGDKIVTESGAVVSITFDTAYANAIQITENSKAVLESIEPTNIRIENGSIFSSINGLAKGSSWNVTTPSAVAAVRGTLYLVRYLALSGQFYAATVDVPNDGKNSAIDIQPLSGSGGANVPEGKEITLEQGQTPSDSLVQDLDPDTLAEIMSFFENLERASENEDGGAAPATGGSEELGGGDSGGGGDSDGPDLDVTELNTLSDNPPAPLPILPVAKEPDPVIDPDNGGGHNHDQLHGFREWLNHILREHREELRDFLEFLNNLRENRNNNIAAISAATDQGKKQEGESSENKKSNESTEKSSTENVELESTTDEKTEDGTEEETLSKDSKSEQVVDEPQVPVEPLPSETETTNEVTPAETESPSDVAPLKIETTNEVTPPEAESPIDVTPPETETTNEVTPPETESLSDVALPETENPADITAPEEINQEIPVEVEVPAEPQIETGAENTEGQTQG